jgi:catalase
MVSYFAQADGDLGARLAKATNVPMAAVKQAVAEYQAAHPQQQLAAR